MPSNGINSADGSSMNKDNTLGKRPSSRVTAPPGGKSSICFGSDDVAPPPKQARKDDKKVLTDKEKPNLPAAGLPAKKDQGDKVAKPGTRVPPGGKSSIVF